jgi:hypothetical protein
VENRERHPKVRTINSGISFFPIKKNIFSDPVENISTRFHQCIIQIGITRKNEILSLLCTGAGHYWMKCDPDMIKRKDEKRLGR